MLAFFYRFSLMSVWLAVGASIFAHPLPTIEEGIRET